MAIGQGSLWEIGRSTGVCAATGRELAPGEPIVVALVEREGSEGFDRAEFGESDWRAARRLDDGRRVFAHWRTTLGEPNSKARLLIDDESLLDMFEQLCEGAGEEGEERSRSALRYLLALVLCRKRLLVMDGARSNGEGEPGGILVRRKGEEGPPTFVADPGMDEATLAEATEQVSAFVRPA